MIKIGVENEILFLIQKEEPGSFGSMSLIMNDFKLIDQQQGNLNDLLRDIEIFNHNFQNSFEDEFFWKEKNYPIIDNWNRFYGAKTLEDLEDPIVIDFNTLFYRVNLSFDSEFFDEFVLIGCKKGDSFYMKVWKKDFAESIYDFKVNSNDLLLTFKELEENLHLDM